MVCSEFGAPYGGPACRDQRGADSLATGQTAEAFILARHFSPLCDVEIILLCVSLRVVARVETDF